ncbi:MAG: hypothetical protein IKL84_00725, partial [Clostridia bacterium]|nr:hypothetical protein [Clostridia bacterium]
VVFVIFSIRSARRGITHLHVLGWFFCLTRIALAFWMEFCITAETAVRNYTIMSLCLLFYMFAGLALYFDGNAADGAEETTSAPAGQPSAEAYFAAAAAPVQAEAADVVPEDFRADIPIRTHNILSPSAEDYFGSTASGRYMVRIRRGNPGARVRAAYPEISRAVINVRGGSVHLQDIFDLMGADLECVSDYTAQVPDGVYHVTMCFTYPGGEVAADPRNIYLCFAPQHSGGTQGVSAEYSAVNDGQLGDPASEAQSYQSAPNRPKFNAH